MMALLYDYVRNPNSHRKRMIGIGIPISQSNPPRIMMIASYVVSLVNVIWRFSFRYREAL